MAVPQQIKRFVLDAISGRRADWKAKAALPGLAGLAGLYRGVVGARTAAYGAGVLKSAAVEVPVISVGNITAGGTGKTPLVEIIAKGLLDRGRRPTILSRGYGPPVREGEGPRAGVSDESLVLADNLPGVPLLLGANRHATARRAIDDHGVDSIVCDDAFQHFGLARDLDVVAVDATFPFGYGHMLPRGLLREPLEGLSRAGVFVVTRSDLIHMNDLKRLVRELSSFAPAAPVVLSRHRPVELRGHVVENTKPLSEFEGRRVAAFSAIGNPRAFGLTLRALGAKVVYAKRFADHHVFTDEELDAVGAEAGRVEADMVVITQKDAVKVRRDPGWPMPLYYLAVELELTDGVDDFWRAVDTALAAGDERAAAFRAGSGPPAGDGTSATGA